MAINVEIKKSTGENTTALLRRFSKRIQSANIVRTVRDRRFYTRPQSELGKKRRALKSIERRDEYEQLLKMGIKPKNAGKRRRR